LGAAGVAAERKSAKARAETANRLMIFTFMDCSLFWRAPLRNELAPSGAHAWMTRIFIQAPDFHWNGFILSSDGFGRMTPPAGIVASVTRDSHTSVNRGTALATATRSNEKIRADRAQIHDRPWRMSTARESMFRTSAVSPATVRGPRRWDPE
jgi:hypothetical protein